MSPRSRLLLGGALCALAIAVAWWTRTADDSAAALRPEATGAVDAESPALGEPNGDRVARLPAPTTGTGATEVALERDARTAAESTGVRGRVLAPSGAPIAGAVISWCVVPETLLQGAMSAESAHQFARDMSVRAKSRPDGTFDLSEANGARESRSVVWITHERFEALPIVFEADAWRGSALEPTLREAEPLNVAVADARGTALADASVSQSGLTVHGLDGVDGRLAWLLEREYMTTADGSARVAPFPGRIRLVASDGGRHSAPWDGVGTSDVRLVIGGSFSLVVEVSGEVNEIVAATAEISCRAVTTHRADVDSEALVAETLAGALWEPREIPLVDAREYVVRLDAIGFVLLEKAFPVPEPGTTVTLELEAKRGNFLWCYVTSTSEEILPEAIGRAEWEQDGRIVARVAHGREDGYMVFVGVPDGLVHVTVRCPGFVPQTPFPIEVSPAEEAAFVVELVRARNVTVEVSAGGSPLGDYEVVAWPKDVPNARRHYSAIGLADGRLTIDEIPEGDVELFVHADGWSPSSVHSISQGDSKTTVAIHLERGIVVLGRATDAASGEPVTGATASLALSSYEVGHPIESDPVRVDSEGRFVLDGAAPGPGAVLVRAPGYSTTRALFDSGSSSSDVVLGDVRLGQRGDLRVRVRTPADADPKRYGLWIDSPDGVRRPVLGADGTVTIDSVSAGWYRFSVLGPDRSQIESWHKLDLDQAPWDIELSMVGEARLRVRAIPPQGERLSPHVVATIRRFVESGDDGQIARFDSAGVATLHADLGLYQVELRDSAQSGGEVLASARVSIDAPGLHDLTLHLGGEDRVLRIVDPSGEPVSSARVTVRPAGQRFEWGAADPTDHLGRRTITGLDTDDVVLEITHPDFGWHLGVELRLAPPGEVTTLTLERGLPVELVLTRLDGAPAAGIRCTLTGPANHALLPERVTDAEGRATWNAVGKGPYRLTVLDPAFKIGHLPVDVDGKGPVALRVRRRTTLECHLTVGGLPGAGAELTLESVEGPSAIAESLAAGFIDSNTGTMTLDDTGFLRLDRVAEGSYAWTLRATTGELTDGLIDLSPDRINVIRASL